MQDIDIVVNELFGDNDEVFVEYSNGPMAYRVRCVSLCTIMHALGAPTPDNPEPRSSTCALTCMQPQMCSQSMHATP